MPPRSAAPTSRRKTRKAAAAETDAEPENALQETGTPPPQGILPFTIGPLLSDIDVHSLSEYFPDASLEAPTPELIIACYKVIMEQKDKLADYVEEIDNLKADADRKDVELDQALQDRERVSKELEDAVVGMQTELKSATEEKEQIGNYLSLIPFPLTKTQCSRSARVT